jgi:hypothetical protein
MVIKLEILLDFENKLYKDQLEVNNVLTIFDNEKLIKIGQHKSGMFKSNIKC